MLFDPNRTTASENKASAANDLEKDNIAIQGEFRPEPVEEPEGLGVETENFTSRPQNPEEVKLAPDLPSDEVVQPTTEILAPETILEEDHTKLTGEKEEQARFLEHLLAEDSKILDPNSEMDPATLNDMVDGISQ